MAQGQPFNLSGFSCRICAHEGVLLVDFGPQPVCHRFLASPHEPELQHPLRLGQCQSCGLLQLIDPIAATHLKPTSPLRYTEPELHLDEVARQISTLPKINENSPVCGLTTKDQSTLKRLDAMGFRRTKCLDAGRELGIQDPCASIETIQHHIADGALQKRLDSQQQYQVVIVRHILEHAHQMDRFIAGVCSLLMESGYLVIEVPDFSISLLAGDYSTIWEEHVVYFTQATLLSALDRWGLDIQHLQIHSYVPEDSLVVIVKARGDGNRSLSHGFPFTVLQELALGHQYADRRPLVRQRWRKLLAEERDAGRKVALLGAGHLGITFLNLTDLVGDVDFVLDDDPTKCGKYAPGSHHLVSNSTVLYEQPIKLCLLSVSPDGEESVLRRHQEFLDRGGEFRSIFPSSRLACFPNTRGLAE